VAGSRIHHELALTPTDGLYWDRRLTGAHRCFTRAVEALAKVRKLTAEARRAQRGTASPSAPILGLYCS